MNESMLNSLMRLFAMIASINRESLNVVARSFVESYLSRQFSKNVARKYLEIYDGYSTELHTPEKTSKSKMISALSVKMLGICR